MNMAQFWTVRVDPVEQETASSTASLCPVIYFAESEAGNKGAVATSSALPWLPVVTALSLLLTTHLWSSSTESL